MNLHEKAFSDELEVFRREADWAIQCYYGALALNGAPFRNRKVLDAMNTTPLFWLTARGAMQSTTWIALGRIFDFNSAHNVNRLLQLAERHRTIFSRQSLAARKAEGRSDADEWVDAYVAAAHVPTREDFRKLRRHVAKHRRIYEARYKAIRDKLHAHKEVTGQPAIDALYVNTTIGEVERMLVFFRRLYDALWELFHNGRAPALRQVPYSASRMLRTHDDHADPWRKQHVQEIIVNETVRALEALRRGVAVAGEGGLRTHARK